MEVGMLAGESLCTLIMKCEYNKGKRRLTSEKDFYKSSNTEPKE